MENFSKHVEEAMEFENQGISTDDADQPDEELLQIQKRKSRPTVVIQEFVASMDDSDDDKSVEDSDEEQKYEQSPIRAKLNEKIKTLFEIQDVSLF